MFSGLLGESPKLSVARCETLFWAVSPSAKQGCTVRDSLVGLSAKRHQTTLALSFSTFGHLCFSTLVSGRQGCNPNVWLKCDSCPRPPKPTSPDNHFLCMPTTGMAGNPVVESCQNISGEEKCYRNKLCHRRPGARSFMWGWSATSYSCMLGQLAAQDAWRKENPNISKSVSPPGPHPDRPPEVLLCSIVMPRSGSDQTLSIKTNTWIYVSRACLRYYPW